MKDGFNQSPERDDAEELISADVSEDAGERESNDSEKMCGDKDFAGKIEELSLKLKELEAENKELKESAAKSRADLYNFRQRTAREREKERKLAKECSVLEILPVLDNLDRALCFPEGTDPASVLNGITMVQRQFMNVLNSMGVKEVPTKGEKFSPSFHEAVALKEVDDPEQDGVIMEEFAKGYMLSDKVIRPAKVQVAKFDDSKGNEQ